MPLEVYTLAEVAEMLNTSVSTVRREIQAGRLTAFRVGTRWRITDAALAAYVEAQTWHPERNAKPEAKRVTATSPGTPAGGAGAPLYASPMDERRAAILSNKPRPRRGN